LDPNRANELFELADRLSTDATKLRAELEFEFATSQLAEVVDEDYDLGEVVGVEQIFGGYVNVSYAVHTRSDAGEQRYFVRKYSRAITEPEVRFEHALVNHINRKGFHLAARVYPNKAGETFVTRDELRGERRETRFFAVYEMLLGEDKYTWVKNRCTDREYDSAARVLAQFHHLAHDFEPGKLAREQPPIMDFVRTLEKTFTDCAGQTTGTSYDKYFLAKLSAILEAVRQGTSIESRLAGLPFIPVHCDYHPGNQKYVDERVVGLFDFDWSKVDYRIFDIALALVYFCSSWEGRDSGDLWLDKAVLFTRAYQEEAAKFDEPGPMSEAELAALPRMIANANLFVLNWDVTAYYEDDTVKNDDEYLMYVSHNVMLMEFIEAHLQELAHLADAQGAMSSPGEPGHSHDQERV
jgi:homoserine kinase type II